MKTNWPENARGILGRAFFTVFTIWIAYMAVVLLKLIYGVN